MSTTQRSYIILVVALAIGISATTNAAAVPEFRYNAKGQNLIFLVSPGVVFETAAGKTITCSGFEGTGKFKNPSPTTEIEKVELEFLGCKGFGVECVSAGEVGGKIKFTGLAAEINYIKKGAPKEVGILLKAAGGGEWGKFECVGKGESKIKGSFIGTFVAPILNVPVFICGGWTIEWKQTASKQEPEMFEGGAAQVLMSSLNGAGAFEVTGFDSGIFLRGSELGREIELKA